MSDQSPRRRPPLSRSQVKSIFQGLEYQDAAAPAPAPEPLPPRQQAFVRHWVGVIGRSNDEIARLFARRAPEALGLLDFDGVEAWLLKALEALDQRGLGWAVEVLDELPAFAAAYARRERTVALGQVEGLLRRLVTGLGGRELRLAAGEPHTDTETLYLPAELAGGDRDDNLHRYKALAAHHWAQTWYGTWRADTLAALLARPEADAVTLFAALERLRLDACLARDLPGLWREMQDHSRRWDAPAPLSGSWAEAARQLAGAAAQAGHSLDWAARLSGSDPPPPACYHGRFLPARVQQVLESRLERERLALRLALGRLVPDPEAAPPGDGGQRKGGIGDRRTPAVQFSLEQQAGEPGAPTVLQLRLGEQPVSLSGETRQLLGSILQDLGEVPPDYLAAGGPKPYDAGYEAPAAPAAATAGFERSRAEAYPEWDYVRQRFRTDYCWLREHEVEPGDADFVTRTLHKHRGLVKTIRRSFEALLGEHRRERRQPGGDDIDLDALVEARADALHGEEMREAVYTCLRDTERSIAVMFMVDMSGSTKGWVNDAEREALVLLCEALETIGDRYAIYGFSGRTHKQVDVYRIKRFEDGYDSRVRRRISGIAPRAYTRMGAPIRHLGRLLGQVPARHKLLITLSDGKPEDYGNYYGRYGIEDTRHALLELRRDGIHSFCITIDKEGGDYLPYMYGAANYACIDEVHKLPLKVADIYRKLTT